MDELELRKEIYDRLGLEFGSLPSESGNDWQRAKDEVLEEQRQKEFSMLQNLKKINYLSVEKESEEYKAVMKSKSFSIQNFQIEITKRNDLEQNEIDFLMNINNKDILINLAKYQKLLDHNIEFIIENSVFLSITNLIEFQVLSDNQKIKLLEKMNNHKNAYISLIEKLNKN